MGLAKYGDGYRQGGADCTQTSDHCTIGRGSGSTEHAVLSIEKLKYPAAAALARYRG